MQSFNKLLSFGDDTLSACIQAEAKNMEIANSASDSDKYFRDNTLLSKITENINNIDQTTETKQKSSNVKHKSSQSYRKCNVTKSKFANNINTLNIAKGKRTTSSRNRQLIQVDKENINFDNTKSNISSDKNTLFKQCNKSDLGSDNSNVKVDNSHNITTETTNGKLSSSNSSISRGEKSSELNSSISIIPTQDRCKLASWGLLPNILQKYEARGISTMFPWQIECLSNYKVIEEKRNLVYSAPTSAGKTLVAEILMIKTVLERRKKVIFILPFVSVVREKMYYFQDLLSDSGIRVEGFMGGIAPPGGFTATHVAIATIEKANSLVNRLMEENELINLGAVVIDELHLVGDPNRGYLLELLLTKLKYMTFRDENINIQLIGMSATLPNLSLLAEWLDAELYKTDFRPIPLNEQCKIDQAIYDNKLCLIRNLKPMQELRTDSDDILYLCIETISDGHSVLIFCPTKNWCEKLAEQLAASICKLGCEDTELGKTLRQQLDSALISETLEQLKRSPAGLDNVLRNTVSFGVAFHHAGLTMDERDIIEGSFRSGSLRILVATSTLSSGVNLPARRVIVRSPMFGGKLLDSLTYRQMIGRAGRMGKDTAGESILMCKVHERNAAQTLLSATLEPIESCLEDSGPLIRALLEAIASEVVYTPSDLELYTKCTLVSLSSEHDAKNPSNEAINFLIDNEFLLLQNTEEGYRWVATAFGKACLAASIPPREGLFLLEELQKARRCFVLDTELHVVYLVTPLSSNQIGAIDWMTFLELWKVLSESERRVGQLVGIEERFLTSAIKGIVRPGKLLSIHKRFYTALALHDLVREVPLNTVCKKYGCCRGVLQSLQQSAATFAGMVTQFCKQLGWDCMELLVSQFQARLQFGVCRELLDLLRLPMLNGLRARSLYKHGITSVADLAVANELDVERALYKALPFESEKEQDGEHESEALKRSKMRTVFVTGRDGLTPHEAAIMLVQEARALVQHELGLQDMSWKPNEQSIITNASNSQPSLQVQAKASQSMECKDIKIKTKGTHNSQQKVHLIQNNVQADYVKDLHLSPKQDIKKNENSTKTELSKFNDTSKVNIDVTENKNSICNLDNNTMKKEKCDNSRLTDQLLQTNIPGISTNVMENIRNPICDLKSNKELQEEKDDNMKLTDQLMEMDMPEFIDNVASKISFDFFEDSSPKIAHDSEQKRNSESLISYKDNKMNRTRNIVAKHSVVDAQSAQNISNTPTKKIKMSDEIIVTRMSSFESNKPPISTSPSLFDDSLNLDTQIYNVLEQNIVDSLNFSEFDDSKFIRSKEIAENKTSSNLKVVDNVNKDVQPDKKQIASKTILTFTNTQAKNTMLSWQDDSWNESEKITEKLNEMKDKNIVDTLVSKSQFKNIKNTTKKYIIETSETSKTKPEIKNKRNARYEDFEDIPDDLKKISQKRRFMVQSPVASVIAFSKNRAGSFDSNKSDSDDIIIPSQDINSPAASIKIRSKLNSERKKGCTQKISGPARDNKKLTDNVPNSIDIQRCKIKPKLKDILPHNVLSNDSIISNSDEGTPVKIAKSIQKSKINLKKPSKNSKSRLQGNECIDSVNETTNWHTLNVITVASDRATFNLFKRELMQKQYIALALNCELYKNEAHIIGTKVIGSSNSEKRRSKKMEHYVCNDKKLSGAAIAWEKNIAYYISFSDDPDLKIPAKEQMKLLKETLCNTHLYVKCFATKEVFKTLYDCCGITATCKFLDPKVASWLYDGSIYEKSFSEMIKEYFPRGSFISKKIGSCYGIGPGLNIKSTMPGEFRASAETVLTWHVTDTLLDKLNELSPTLVHTFKDVEMKTVTLLACMELNGLGVSLKSLQNLSATIRQEMTSLEERAYALSGKKFNFSSSKEVGKILGLCKGKKVSVNKVVLGQCDHPISSLVMSWRKLNATQSKIVYPIMNLAQHGPRIHGNCVTCTLTGRISMHEPNLQNVPRDFPSEDNSFTISVRMAFIPAMGNVMLSADYCQLELRILAHFSMDSTLCDIMRKPGDIFKSIAANWNHVNEDQVDEKMRQHTKQLCYGMIYGMGVKTLAESLTVDEAQAQQFLQSFMNAYPGISMWMNNVLEEARTNGYITTILERRRMLPGLTSTNSAEKLQAERQAINTKIQGSAADIAKKAMVNIEERMRCEFPTVSSVMPAVNFARKLRSSAKETQLGGGYLVLQLHDELLYEVNIKDLMEVAKIVKESMEQVCQLAVPLPIKLRVGPAWGDLSEYNL